MNVHVNPARLKREWNLAFNLLLVHDNSAVFPTCGVLCFFHGKHRGRRCFLLRRTPSRCDMALQLLVGSVGA